MRKQTLVVVLAVTLQAADSFPPSAEQMRQIQGKVSALSARVKGLAARQVDAALLADVDVYRKAAEWILRYPEEFYSKAYTANTIAALDKGLARATELESGGASWPKHKGRLVRAYTSRVDGSVQPYGVMIPDSYDGRPTRLDLGLP